MLPDAPIFTSDINQHIQFFGEKSVLCIEFILINMDCCHFAQEKIVIADGLLTDDTTFNIDRTFCNQRRLDFVCRKRCQAKALKLIDMIPA